MTADQIRAQLDGLQYRAMVNDRVNRSGFVPPSIRSSGFAGIAKQMSKLESDLAKLGEKWEPKS